MRTAPPFKDSSGNLPRLLLLSSVPCLHINATARLPFLAEAVFEKQCKPAAGRRNASHFVWPFACSCPHVSPTSRSLFSLRSLAFLTPAALAAAAVCLFTDAQRSLATADANG